MIKKFSLGKYRCFSRLWQQGLNFANLPSLGSCTFPTLIALKHLMPVSSMWPIGPLVLYMNWWRLCMNWWQSSVAKNVSNMYKVLITFFISIFMCGWLVHWIFGDQGFIIDLHILGLLGIIVSQFCCLLLNTTNYMILKSIYYPSTLSCQFEIMPRLVPTRRYYAWWLN